MALLKKIGQLEDDLKQEEGMIQERGLLYCKAFKSLLKTVDHCFGNCLEPGWEDTIKQFQRDYLELDLSVIPKV